MERRLTKHQEYSQCQLTETTISTLPVITEFFIIFLLDLCNSRMSSDITKLSFNNSKCFKFSIEGQCGDFGHKHYHCSALG